MGITLVKMVTDDLGTAYGIASFGYSGGDKL